MYIDNQLVFSDAQDLTATAVSTNVLDMGVARDLGAGEPLWLVFMFGTVVSTATFNFSLKGADDAAISSSVLIKLDLNAAITPTSNTQYAARISPGVPKRYWRVDYTLSGGTSPHIPTTAVLVKDAEIKRHTRVYY